MFYVFGAIVLAINVTAAIMNWVTGRTTWFIICVGCIIATIGFMLKVVLM